MACDFFGGVEFLGDVCSGIEVHLVGRLTAERRVGKARVVLVHIERDQLLESAERVQRVQEQPLVFERSPEVLYPLPIL